MKADSIITWMSFWPYVLVGLLLLVVILVFYVVISRRKARKQAPALGQESDASQEPRAAPGQLRRSFAQAHRLLKTHVAGRQSRYRVPWFLMLGEAESGKTTLLGNLGLHYPLGKPNEERHGTHPPCNWWFFDQGVVLDIAGNILGQAKGHVKSDKGWQTLLRLLRFYRTKRPIDGVILTIPSTDLIDLNLQDKTAMSRIKDKAAYLYRHLWQTQHRLGMRFPVYIVLTKCDQIPGFQSLCRNLPEARHQDIVGWSSPYTIETAYIPTWVDEAFDRFSRQLFQTQIEIFTVRHEVRESDGVFQFPGAFQALREPLRVYLDQLFTPSVYHESFFFRGLYLCGDGSRDTASTADPAPPQPLFLRHLFERKILPESSLARPVSKKSVAAHRTMRTAQGLAALFVLVGGLGLWHASSRLAHNLPELLQTLHALKDDLQVAAEVINGKKNTPDESTDNLLDQEARDAIEHIDQISRRDLTSPFLPNSWWRFTPQFEFAPLNVAVSRAVAHVYNHIILRNILYQLDSKAEGLATEPKNSGHQNGLGVLQNYIDQLGNLEKEYTQLNDIQDQDNLKGWLSKPEAVQNIQNLMSTVFGGETQLPKKFFNDRKFYRYVSDDKGESKFDPQNMAPKQGEKARDLAERYYDSLFCHNAVLENLDGLTRYIQTIEASEEDITIFQNLLACIEETQTLLDDKESKWMTAETFDFGDQFNAVLDRIKKSEFLGDKISKEIKDEGARQFEQLKKDLRQFERRDASDVGPLLRAPDEKTPLQLSLDLMELKTALQEWLHAPFMASSRGEENQLDTHASSCARVVQSTPSQPDLRQLSSNFPAYNRLDWEETLLLEAEQLAPTYEAFLQEDLKTFPVSWRGAIVNVARNQLAMNISALLTEARQDVPPSFRTRLADALRLDFKRFQESAELINQLLKTLERLDLDAVYRALLDVVALQAQHWLREVDSLLAQDALYTPLDDTFAWWHGEKSLAFRAFGVADTEGLSQYLHKQRQRVSAVATQYAEPLVAFLRAHPVELKQEDAESLTKWDNILAALDNYKNQTPGNSVAVLEQFILGLNEVEPETCLPEPAATPLPRSGTNYFLQQRDQLRHALDARCQQLATHMVVDRYQKLAEHFTHHLAGRFPFFAGELSQIEAEATPGAIRAFFGKFDKSMQTIRTILQRDEQFGDAGRRVLDFLKQLKDIRDFFASFIDGIGGIQSPVYDLQVAFRVNRQPESNADQIIDWRLQVGDQLLRYHGATEPSPGRWRYGVPVQLSLRWAKNAPWVPATGGHLNGGQGRGDTVVYADTSNWSFLRFLRRHAAAPIDFDQLADPDPHTLAFTITTTPQPANGQRLAYGEIQTETSRARALIRITVMSPDKKERLVVPVFPPQAPELSAEGGETLAVSSR